MKRFAVSPALALVLCIAFFGFVSEKEETSDASQVTVNVSSEASRAGFEIYFETESAFSVATKNGITPMTFTVEAGNFSSVISPKGDVTLKVEVTREDPNGIRTSSSSTRIVREGDHIELLSPNSK